jgi:hypothetical protein
LRPAGNRRPAPCNGGTITIGLSMGVFMTERLVETWLINNRVNLRLIEALSDEALAATLSPKL